MRKYFISQLTIILILIVSIFPVTAHSGRTDANGGHHVTATGDYHYHHGQPPHQHINGQCPYDFDDQTGINSGGSSSVSGNDNNIVAHIKGVNKSSPFDFFGEDPFIALILIYIVYQIIKAVIKSFLEKRKYTKDKAYYTSLYQGKTAFDLANVPSNVRFDDEDLPVWIDNSDLRWGKEYTVYTTYSGYSYHLKEGCCGARQANHLFRVSRLNRCAKCSRTNGLNDYVIPEWYHEYRKIKDIKKKYKID